MRKAIFIDRDGTLNHEIYGVTEPEKLVLLPDVGKAIKILNGLKFLIIVITNQGLIAKEKVTEKTIEAIHTELVKKIAAEGGSIDKIYYCPHHPQGTIAHLAISCTCRKPDIGLIMQAVHEFSIDTSKSYFIGDATWDMLAGKRAGIKTILVKTGYAGLDKRYEVTPDYVTENIFTASQIIKNFHA